MLQRNFCEMYIKLRQNCSFEYICYRIISYWQKPMSQKSLSEGEIVSVIVEAKANLRFFSIY